ncbi:putative ubiquitin carboxyl-terminal hydrolase putative cysteine peptidase Clan CA family C12 [Leptomonas seymouri]|uniref:Ubiquitin carboxyl-terminal hydrolase n=1 Tax=Leptomonas seymouri TaxID=5684 RepID=A0A0N1I0E1_LEPSE|nr:putative ubiquitin carboxyl-terminal hydrolase putative cysteine peptidase Clan CA family C12 [Leptomonas seymouri]|eukprot:KPI89281.1 putative ubiquitin carboxyl-terminal hydrolase putative cysteine peptidase Clan CA family C12 [Leptomonas seymouri]
MWFPLESNPEVMTKYLISLGIPEPKLEFVDVFGVSQDMLSMVPTPVHAVMLVYPICAATEKRAQELEEAQQDEVDSFRQRHPFFFTKQEVGNACGTIAILHAVMNNLPLLGNIAPGSALDNLLKATSGTSNPVEVGGAIAASKELAHAHAGAAEEGVTLNQPIDANINLHFVCFVCVGGRCIELDGRKPNPIFHGACHDSASFLQAAAEAIQEKMDLNPDSYEFGITALVDKQTSG